MATLSSIPESNPDVPGRARPRHRGQSIASFERVRPRSRVVVLSRRPSRARYPKRSGSAKGGQPQHYANPTSDVQTSADARHAASDAAERERKLGQARRGGFPPAGRVSDKDLLTYESLVPPLDSERFIATSTSKLPLSSTTSQLRDAQLPLPEDQEQDQTVLCTSYQNQVSISSQTQSDLDDIGSVDGELPDRWYGDATTDVASPKRTSRLDEELVEAVTRNVVQQLRLLSITSQPRSGDGSSEISKQPTLDQFVRTSSQNAAIDGFAKELQRYAEHTGAIGKLPVFTPTPVRSGVTLRTVSELVPFRPEFKAAGLAVTSKDQARRSSRPTKADLARAARRQPIRVKNRRLCPSQFDGKDSSVGNTTEISFVTSKDVDDWRYALIDEISPRRKKQHAAVKKHSLSRCIPCYPNDDQTTDGEGPRTTRGLYQKSSGVVATQAQSSLAEAATTVPKTPAKSGRRRESDAPISPHNTSSLSIQQTVKAESKGPGATEGKLHRETAHPRPAFFAGPKRQTAIVDRPQQLVTAPMQSATVETCYDTVPPDDGREEVKECLPHSSPPEIPLKSYLRSIAQHARPEAGDQSSQDPDQDPPCHDLARDPQNIPASMPNLHELEKDVVQKPSTKSTKPAAQHSLSICSRGLSSPPRARPNIPRRVSSMQGSLRHAALRSGGDISDRDVLRGLHIAASAACDEQIDAFIRHKTGLQIRRFLADLMMLENLGDGRPGEDYRKHVEKRRTEMRALKQQVRRSREIRNISLRST